ncbi:RNA-directed DNA polymerase, eukaryota [Tanacetum coccineum]
MPIFYKEPPPKLEREKELTALTDPMKKEVSVVRKKIDSVNKELKSHRTDLTEEGFAYELQKYYSRPLDCEAAQMVIENYTTVNNFDAVGRRPLRPVPGPALYTTLDTVMLWDSLRDDSLSCDENGILANRLKMVISELISDVQSAFVSNRQILDGPFILNELISWCKAHKSKAMIFKVDFEKAFDSVRWDFLDIILRNFGFGIKWRGWIQGCLSSAMGSILVNGSPTAEFKFPKGLKQGDLSPYLCGFQFIPLELYLVRAQFYVSKKRSFPRLYALELKKGITVADKLIDASFVASFRRNPRGGVEEEQLTSS